MKADALLEQIDRDRLLVRVQLVRAPARRQRHDPDRAEQPAAAGDVHVLGAEARLGQQAEERHHDEGGPLDAGALRRVRQLVPFGLEQLRERPVGVRGEQPDHLLGERQDLDFELIGREPHHDVVALEGAEAGRQRVLGVGLSDRRTDGQQHGQGPDDPSDCPTVRLSDHHLSVRPSDRPTVRHASLASAATVSRSSAIPSRVRALVMIT